MWEDETHALLSVFQDGTWSMVRMDVDGAMEFAVAPQKGNQEQRALALRDPLRNRLSRRTVKARHETR